MATLLALVVIIISIGAQQKQRFPPKQSSFYAVSESPPCDGNALPGSICEVQCADGYAPTKGMHATVCNASGVWIGAPLECAPIVQCTENITQMLGSGLAQGKSGPSAILINNNSFCSAEHEVVQDIFDSMSCAALCKSTSGCTFSTHAASTRECYLEKLSPACNARKA